MITIFNKRYKTEIVLIISMGICICNVIYASCQQFNYLLDLDAGNLRGEATLYLAQAEKDSTFQSKQIIPSDRLKIVPPKTTKLNLTLRPLSRPPFYKGRAVQFSVETKPSYTGIQYYFDFGDGSGSGWSSNQSVTHLYAKEGVYSVVARARGTIDDIEQQSASFRVSGESTPLRLSIETMVKAIPQDDISQPKPREEKPDVKKFLERIPKELIEAFNKPDQQKERPSSKLVARIEPDRVTIVQGEPATFRSTSLYDPDSPVNINWTGPGGQRGKKSPFTVDTSSISPGKYRVVLEIADNRDQRGDATATLEIVSSVKYRATVKVTPENVREGEAVQFSTSITPEFKYDTYYRYRFGDGSQSDWLKDAIVIEHVYQKSGTYYAWVEVNVEGKAIGSNKVEIVVDKEDVPPPRERPSSRLVARIEPERITVRQGEQATFRSTSLYDKDSQVNENWSGPGGQRGYRSPFKVNTDSINPGNYRVVLEISDNLRRREQATATLEILPSVKYRATVKAKPEGVKGGEAVQFDTSITPEFKYSKYYRYNFGDGSQSEWIKDANVIEHVYQKSGIYNAWVEVNVEGQSIGSNRVKIVVDKEPPKPMAMIYPMHREVMQGESALFESQSTHGPEGWVKEFWAGPGMQKRKGRAFNVETGELEPGKYEITLDIIDNHNQKDSTVATLVIKRRPQKPVAKINPRQREVIQGESTLFESHSIHDPEANLKELWTVNGKKRGEGESLEINSDELNPGRYEIALEIVDTYNQRDRALATLEVLHPSLTKPVAVIYPHHVRVVQGGGTIFESRSTHAEGVMLTGQDWTGPGGQTGTGRHFEVNTNQLSPGSYKIVLNIIDDRNQRDRGVATLEVVSSLIATPPDETRPPIAPFPKIIWIIGILIIVLVGGFSILFMIRRSRKGTHHGKPSLHIRPHKDYGTPHVESPTLIEKPALQLRPVSDSGAQHIESEGTVIVDERRDYE